MSEYQPKMPVILHKGSTDDTKRVIVMLDRCSLETAKIGTEFQLLNADDHQEFLKKNGRDPSEMRPDITHQCLLSLLDSPLNKAGHMQIFMRTEKNVLIHVNPKLRIPRTYKRFSGLMVQLLHKLSIKAADGAEKLLKVVRNPVTDHFPPNCRKVGTSHAATHTVRLHDYVKNELPLDEPVVWVIGGMAHGHVNPDFLDDKIGISDYPLSASLVCSKLCDAYEQLWDIL